MCSEERHAETAKYSKVKCERSWALSAAVNKSRLAERAPAVPESNFQPPSVYRTPSGLGPGPLYCALCLSLAVWSSESIFNSYTKRKREMKAFLS